MANGSSVDIEPFLGPKLKLERAKRHFHELEDALTTFAGRCPYALIGEFNPHTGKSRVRVGIKETIPEGVATIIGDAIHNLHSALDILVCDLAALTGDTSRRARFPFWKDAGGEKQAMNKLGSTFDPGCRQVIHALKPYPGGNDLLRSLHDLDIIDKHQLIIAAISHTSISRQEFGSQITRYAEPQLVEDGDILLADVEPHEIELQQQPAGTFNIAFGNGMPMTGQPIPGTLVDMTNMVHEIIEGFERYCVGRRLL